MLDFEVQESEMEKRRMRRRTRNANKLTRTQHGIGERKVDFIVSRKKLIGRQQNNENISGENALN